MFNKSQHVLMYCRLCIILFWNDFYIMENLKHRKLKREWYSELLPCAHHPASLMISQQSVLFHVHSFTPTPSHLSWSKSGSFLILSAIGSIVLPQLAHSGDTKTFEKEHKQNKIVKWYLVPWSQKAFLKLKRKYGFSAAVFIPQDR